MYLCIFLADKNSMFKWKYVFKATDSAVVDITVVLTKDGKIFPEIGTLPGARFT